MVAGGAGFVGSAIVRELLTYNCKVISFDNYLHGVQENVANLDGVTVVQGDALNQMDLIKCMLDNKVEFVLNCIGDTYVPSAYLWPKRFFDVNVTACLNLLEACNVCGVKRMLYVSSTEVYGVTDVEVLDENIPLNPVNTYAVSKLAADRLCYTHNLEHNTPVVVARIFNCYGPRETEPYIVPEIIYQLNKSNTLLLGNYRAERDFTFVHDTARALIMVLQSDMKNGDVVNVGSNNSYSMEWLTHSLAEIMNVKNLRIQQDAKRLRKLDIDKFRCDNRKLIRYTGWKPKMSMQDGLEQTVSWFYKNNRKWSWESFVKDNQMIK
jgi:nucleoside-diphosphate-sugar epimerase